MTAGPASGPASLLDEARALTKRPGSTCGVELLFLHRPDLEAQLREALAANIDATAIARALKAKGVDVSADALRRHRSKSCKCPS